MALQRRTLGVCVLVPLLAAGLRAQPDRSSVGLQAGEGRVRVTIAGEPFTEYRFRGLPRPALYPVFGPGSVAMTRNYPMAAGQDEAKDHPHHTSFWFSHGDVNGHDFWSTSKKSGRIVHTGFASGGKATPGTLRARNLWLSHEGVAICTDARTLAFGTSGTSRIVDFTITLEASNGPLKLGDTKEGTLALRLDPRLRLRGKVAAGTAVNSEGVSGRDVWGKRARWVDYSAPMGDGTLGVAILDHPDNPRHPTWWHARDYGLFAANPFGAHDFEKKPKGAGDLIVADGQSLTLRYRIILHEGDAKEAGIAGAFRAFTDEP